jgi:glutamine amidotransferase
MQLLFDSSEEDATAPDQPVTGLGILPGKVVRFVSPIQQTQQQGGPDQRIKIPHMGWNQIHWHNADPLLQGVAQGSEVYFVHSYYVKPDDQAIVSATTTYGLPFCASLWRRNIWATQFHPEKSQRIGLALLRNFAHRCNTPALT